MFGRFRRARRNRLFVIPCRLGGAFRTFALPPTSRCATMVDMKLVNRPVIAPSILSADFTDIRSAVARCEKYGAPWMHLDIMDGRFVPNLTFGPKMAADLRKRTRLFLDAHLMTVEPERLVPAFLDAGVDAVTFHLEACVHAHRLVREIKDSGTAAGVSVVPSTPVSALECLLPFVDLILVMTVNPGFGGQKLIPECLEKVKELDAIRKRKGYEYKISVDGGVNETTLPSVAMAGPDVLVMGSAFFEGANPEMLMGAVSCAYSDAAFESR